MNLPIVTKEQNIKLKELGFDMDMRFAGNFPLTAIVLKWLRDVKKIHINFWTEDNDTEWRFNLEFLDGNDHKDDATTQLIIYRNHEEAEMAGLNFALEYLSNKK